MLLDSTMVFSVEARSLRMRGMASESWPWRVRTQMERAAVGFEWEAKDLHAFRRSVAARTLRTGNFRVLTGSPSILPSVARAPDHTSPYLMGSEPEL